MQAPRKREKRKRNNNVKGLSMSQNFLGYGNQHQNEHLIGNQKEHLIWRSKGTFIWKSKRIFN